MTDCPMQPAGPNRWRCPNCGFTFHGPQAPRSNCPAAPDVQAEGLARLLRALDDLTSQPNKRPPQEVGRLLALCQRCEDFHAGLCRVYDGCPSKPRLSRVLTDPALSCPDWPALRAAVEGPADA